MLSSTAPRRRPHPRTIPMDRALEELPLFRLSDTTGEEAAITYATDDGGRWRVLADPGERLPGTFDQDVYVELMRRFHDAGAPDDGAVVFTLHAFLRSMGRQVDGRTYEQLRGALGRLHRTTLQSEQSYYVAAAGTTMDASFNLLTSVAIERRRAVERDQLALFPAVAVSEPGEARVVITPSVRQNLAARYSVQLDVTRYFALPSPVARRLYRLLEVARARDILTWRVSLERLRDQLPLSQRYPSHLQRVLQPANEMLRDHELVREATIRQHQRDWFVDYVLNARR